ncbi:MAG TPA: glycosyltransferase family 4 protein [Solirubrobacteraceae bacterium]|nr:glycosyltransferase family 4 protein [Solirubrobacteraceae bacterium]
MLCSGLGHAMRGFESFATECFAELSSEPGLRMGLLKARGPARGDDRTARAPGRASRTARLTGRAVGRDGYFAEQMLYALRVLPRLARGRPDVVYVSDVALAGALGRWRRASRQRFRLLLSNGAPLPPPFDWSIDHVQQLTPGPYEAALAHGDPPERHTLLPLGVAMEPEPDAVSGDRRAALRGRLGLPDDRPVVLSVAALNLWSKRLDRVVDAVASLEPRPYLVLLGEREEETPAVLRAATAALGADGFTARTVTPREVADHYRAADAFVLASRHESMGRVLVEALSHGLPVVAHDGPVMRFVTGDEAFLADLARPEAVAATLDRALAAGAEPAARRARHAFVHARFSWDALRPGYVEMLEAVAAAPSRARERRRAR